MYTRASLTFLQPCGVRIVGSKPMELKTHPIAIIDRYSSFSLVQLVVLVDPSFRLTALAKTCAPTVCNYRTSFDVFLEIMKSSTTCGKGAPDMERPELMMLKPWDIEW